MSEPPIAIGGLVFLSPCWRRGLYKRIGKACGGGWGAYNEELIGS